MVLVLEWNGEGEEKGGFLSLCCVVECTVYCMRMYNAVSQKRSAKGYNFKEDDIYSL